MKKFLTLFLMSTLILILAACGGSNQTSSDEQAPDENKEVQEEEKALTAEEVFVKTTEATNDLNSFSIKMAFDQEMTMPTDTEPETIAMKFDATMDFILDPMSMYMTMSTEIPDLGENITIEMYLVENVMYMMDSYSGQWMKTTDDALLGDMNTMQMDPSEQLALFENFAEDFSLEEQDDQYVLTITSKDNSFMEIVKQLTPNLDQTPGLEETLDSMTFNELSYTMNIDKESFLPTTFDMVVDMSMEVEGETLTIKQNSTGEYTNFDGVDSITIPEEVQSSAVDLSESTIDGTENGEEGAENSEEITENPEENAEEPAENTETEQ